MEYHTVELGMSTSRTRSSLSVRQAHALAPWPSMSNRLAEAERCSS